MLADDRPDGAHTRERSMRMIHAVMGMATAVVGLGAATAVAAPVCPIRAAGAPTLGAADANPAEYSARITNPWFPLHPGTVYLYRGTADGRRVVELLQVTRRTTRIMGIPARVVRDRLYADGDVVEDTTDWYTQDRAGSVWYLGEATATLKDGRVVDRSGSFRAGTAGARAGLVMPATPRRGAEFQQELYAGHAEDRFRVQSVDTRVRVPFVTARHGMRTLECSPLEPAVLDAKLYVRGVGVVGEVRVRGEGPPERLELVTVMRT